MKIQAAAVAGIVLASLAGAVSDARACGFFNYHEVHSVPRKAAPLPVARAVAPSAPQVPARERIATADQRLDQDRLADAGAEVLAAFPAIKTMDVTASPLEMRAHGILALAVVKSRWLACRRAGLRLREGGRSVRKSRMGREHAPPDRSRAARRPGRRGNPRRGPGDAKQLRRRGHPHPRGPGRSRSDGQRPCLCRAGGSCAAERGEAIASTHATERCVAR